MRALLGSPRARPHRSWRPAIAGSPCLALSHSRMCRGSGDGGVSRSVFLRLVRGAGGSGFAWWRGRAMAGAWPGGAVRRRARPGRSRFWLGDAGDGGALPGRWGTGPGWCPRLLCAAGAPVCSRFRATRRPRLMAVWPDDGCASTALPQLLRRTFFPWAFHPARKRAGTPDAPIPREPRKPAFAVLRCAAG